MGGLALTLAGLTALPALADAVLVERIPQVKPSVIAVGTYLRTRAPSYVWRGTGFAVGDGTLIVTNAHVVPALVTSDEFEELVAQVTGADGEPSIRKLTKLVSDPPHDLAVLKLSGAPLPALALGDSNTAREGQSVAFTGFPILGVLGPTPATHHGIIAALAPVVIAQAHASQLNAQQVRQLREGGFKIFQLDATAYPGNSGSPVYDPTTGQVLAVLNSVFIKSSKEAVLSDPSGISYAMPVSLLKPLLEAVK